MIRCLTALATALATSLSFADVAEAHHERSDGAVRLRIGPIEFRAPARLFAKADRRRGVVVSRSVSGPFPYDAFENPDEVFPFEQGEDGHWRYLRNGRARVLDRELGAALDEMRRDGAELPSSGAVKVSLIPPAAPGRGGVAITEDAPETETEVGVASVADVRSRGAEAFAMLSAPDAMGLPELSDGEAYYVLDGRVVTLDVDAQQALTISALESALQ